MPKRTLSPVELPCFSCPKCSWDHPNTRWMNSQQVAGFLGLSVQTVYKYKSLGILPDTIPGRTNPFWLPCVIAEYLYGKKVA